MRKKIIINGGGICGLTTAIALQDFFDIERDLFNRYSAKVSSLQQVWQNRIMSNPFSHDVLTIHKGTKISSWPEDLIGCVSQQLSLAISRLQGEENVKNICFGIYMLKILLQLTFKI